MLIFHTGSPGEDQSLLLRAELIIRASEPPLLKLAPRSFRADCSSAACLPGERRKRDKMIKNCQIALAITCLDCQPRLDKSQQALSSLPPHPPQPPSPSWWDGVMNPGCHCGASLESSELEGRLGGGALSGKEGRGSPRRQVGGQAGLACRSLDELPESNRGHGLPLAKDHRHSKGPCPTAFVR